MKDPNAAQDQIVDDFSLFPEWLDRYQYLIDLGRKLEPLRDEERCPENILEGCQSSVWLVMDGDRDAMHIRANSDAAIVSGLIALLIKVYDGVPPQDVLDTEPRFIDELGLSQHLSQTRASGLGAMMGAIRQKAAELAASM